MKGQGQGRFGNPSHELNPFFGGYVGIIEKVIIIALIIYFVVEFSKRNGSFASKLKGSMSEISHTVFLAIIVIILIRIFL